MKFILVFVMLVVTSVQANSQCDKKVSWYASKGEMYDANGTLLDTKVDSIFLETGPQRIWVKFKSDEKDLEGTVNEKKCDWAEPFRNGKTVYNATVSLEGGTSNATFTLEARDGKITLTVQVEAMIDKKFLIHIDRYEEVK